MLKRNHLINRDVPEEELERLLQRDETEQEYDLKETTTRKRKRPKVIFLKLHTFDENDFNSLASSCLVIPYSLVFVHFFYACINF